MLNISRLLSIFTLLISVQIIEIYCERGYILVAPIYFDVGDKEPIHITVLDIDTPGTVSISLVEHWGFGINKVEKIFNKVEEIFNKEGSKRIELEVPSDITTFNRNYSGEITLLKVEGIFGGYTFQDIQRITLRTRKELMFLDTDKPFYKAGQTVKFRVLIVNFDLKPLKYNPIGNIWITDRNRVRLAQWKNITFKNGFIHEEMELPEEPVLGNWTLHVQVNSLYKTKNFVINEYVLPTFEVKITPPSKYFSPNQNFTWTICANYTYGKPVQGKLLTELRKHHDGKELPSIRNEEEFDGCTEITYHMNDIMADPRSLNGELEIFAYKEVNNPKFLYVELSIEMFAEVIEYGTDTKMNATSTIYPTLNRIWISRKDNLQYFRAGLPLRTKLVVHKSDSTLVVDIGVKVCAQIKRINWTDNREIVNKMQICKYYKTDQQGEVVVTVPPQPSNTAEIKIKAGAILSDKNKYQSTDIVTFRFLSWYSITGHFLQIEPLDSAVECKTTVEFEILYTAKRTESGKIYYQVMSKGDVIHDGFLNYAFDSKEDLANYRDETYLGRVSGANFYKTYEENNAFPNLNHIGKFTLKFDVDFKMLPNAHLILYSVNKEGNVLADSTSFEVKPCFTNPVKLKFSEETQLPGAKTIIQLSATPQSICSIGIVDKSVYLLDKGDLISKSKVYNELRNFDSMDIVPPNHENGCKKETENRNIVGFVDAITAFKKARVMVLSDLDLVTRPCPSDPREIYGTQEFEILSIPPPPLCPRVSETIRNNNFPSSETTVRSKETTVPSHETTVRSYFPETWLWGIYFVGEDGELFLNEKMPGSITEWQGTSVCLHPDAGLGISESASIIGFQPFFTSLTLPYSVIRGETAPIIVTVFNYLKECLPIKIHLYQSDDFQLHNDTFTFSDCICGGKSVTKRFFISPKRLGKINITATASTIKDEKVCNNVSVAEIDKSDTLIKPLIVEAEGFPKEEIMNEFFCMEDTNDGIYKQNYDILLNKEVVEGSERAFVSVIGDLMGPTLEGLENLVRMPDGWGEYNMMVLAPNIVILDYLTSINRLTDEIRQKTIDYIKQGYMDQQDYRHYDGSYSDYGKDQDKTGSMWLTAFVVRSFASAARYIEVDKDDLEKSRNWIISHQQDNGCFPIIGRVHYTDMKGGVGKEDKTQAILTAYVLTSLLLSGDVNKTVIEKAMKCIEAKNNPSDYALSIFAYATSFIDEEATQRYLKELNKNIVTEGFIQYWKNEDRSIAIETASYAILSSFNIKNNQNVLLQNSGIAKWLTLQRNSYGKYMLIQGTIIAIEALAKYASIVKREKLNMNITVISNDLEEVFKLDEENEFLVQRTGIPTLPANIDMEARGKGCALFQIVHRYNVPSTKPSEHFNLTAESKRKQNDFKKATLDICASLKNEDESDMILMEIIMLSGFVADKETVKSLLSVPELEIKRFDIKENQINLYFNQMTNQSKCFQFDVVQESEVEDTKAANIKIYYYYAQDKTATISYFIRDEDNLV